LLIIVSFRRAWRGRFLPSAQLPFVSRFGRLDRISVAEILPVSCPAEKPFYMQCKKTLSKKRKLSNSRIEIVDFKQDSCANMAFEPVRPIAMR
jgi:hypothetical protein